MQVARDFFLVLGQYAIFLVGCFRVLFRHGVPWRSVLQNAYSIGWKSLPILVIISIFVGTNLSLQGYTAFRPLGGQRLVGMFVALAGVRELAPIIASSMIAAKAGTEMASQLGVMRIQSQIDALEVMAVNPVSELVLPRMVGTVLMVPALTIISVFVTVVAAYLTAVHQIGLSGHQFLEFAAEPINPSDFLYMQIKGFGFGLVICTVSCFFGFTCGRGPEGVGTATNRAVVVSAVACVILNYVLSELLYGGSF